MTQQATICVGTLGQGIWRSGDGGDTWLRVRHGLYSESAVRALAVHPSDSRMLYYGADSGVYRSEDKGEHWELLDSPMNQLPIWALAIDPIDPNVIFAGTRPAALFRSRDGGQHWDKLPVAIAEECPNVGIPRVTALLVGPVDHQHVWAGLEVDGVRHSKDGGETWEVVTGGVTDPDIHNLAITAGSPKTLLTITPREVFSSTDNGATWEPVQISRQLSIPFCRGVLVKADDPQVIYLGNGESAFGGVGALHRSRDRGQTWETLPVPVPPTGRSGTWPATRQTLIFCWPAASTARSSAAPMRGIPGASLLGSSARSTPSPGCRTSARSSMPAAPSTGSRIRCSDATDAGRTRAVIGPVEGKP